MNARKHFIRKWKVIKPHVQHHISRTEIISSKLRCDSKELYTKSALWTPHLEICSSNLDNTEIENTNKKFSPLFLGASSRSSSPLPTSNLQSKVWPWWKKSACTVGFVVITLSKLDLQSCTLLLRKKSGLYLLKSRLRKLLSSLPKKKKNLSS